jgi:hypothetical protein
MILRKILFILVTFGLVAGISGCNLLKVINPNEEVKSDQGNTVNLTPSPQEQSPSETVLSTASAPPLQQAPAKNKLFVGQYRCGIENCISEKFIEDYPVLNGLPPFEVDSSFITLMFDENGKVTDGVYTLRISTFPEGGESCMNGYDEFTSQSQTGTYNPDTNTLVVDFYGEETYRSYMAGHDCYLLDTTIKTTKQLIFMLNDHKHLVLCKTGETGETCLKNPMAILE